MENFAQFTGRFHPLFVHLPIGILLVAILFDWLGSKKRFVHLKASVKMLYLIGGISAALSCLTGYLLASNGDYTGVTLGRHQWLGISVAVVSFGIYFAKSKGVMLTGVWAIFISVLLLLMIMITGHLGGTLTHGSDYLTAYAPHAFKSRLGGGGLEQKTLSNIQEVAVYQDVVVPILKSNCYKCHGADKQKGKLRLDSREYIESGGKSKKLLVKSGLPEESELIRRLHLPKSDKKLMPPKKEKALSKEQIQILEWWIREGAPFDGQVKSLSQSEEIQSLLNGFSGSAEENSSGSEFPDISLKPVKTQDLKALKAINAVVLPVGQSSNLLGVNFVNVKQVGKTEMDLLRPIREHIVWLRMSGSDLEDDLLSGIADMPNITKLYLDDNKLTDQIIPQFNSLKYLKYLNLVGTPTSYQGLKQLGQSESLKKIFIYRTNTSAEERNMLVHELAPIVVDTGGYFVPTFVSDTTIVKGK